MKLFIFAPLLMFVSLSTFASELSDPDFRVGQTVTIVAPHFLDDGRVGKILQYNGAMANVEYSQIVLGEASQPTVKVVSQLWQKDQLRAFVETDMPYHTGQLVRVNAQGFPENGIIGTVKAADGKQVILEYHSDPTTVVRKMWSNDRVIYSKRSDFAVYPGDLIRVKSRGFGYTNLNSKVNFTNGASIWISYMDNTGRDQMAIVPASNYDVLEKSFHIDFGFDVLSDSMRSLASVMYGSRQTYFTVIASHLDQDLPIDGNSLSASAAVAARLFVSIASEGVILDADSDIFTQQVIPAYKEMRAGLPVRRLSDVELSLQVTKAATLVMRASLEAIIQSVGNPTDKAALNDLHTKVGMLAASRLTRNDMATLLTAAQSQNALLTRLLGDYQTHSMATVFSAVVEYLQSKN